MFDPQCNFRMPCGLNVPNPASYWGRSNTFPSGHAAIFAVFIVGLMYVSRLAGAFCLVYSLIICSIRLFFGIHYPTDILGGACIGVLTAYFARTRIVEYLLTRRVLTWSNRHPSSFYAGFFITTYIVATGFDRLKEITDPIRHLMKILWH
jgi:undecaprenyl-diphosphatase